MGGFDHARFQAVAERVGRWLPEPVRVRPPVESGSVLIRATRGCQWNGCRYCNLYREAASGNRPITEVLDDLDLAAALHGPGAKRLFLGDADILACRPEELQQMVARAREVLPALEAISAYATPSSALQWTPAQLAALRESGLLHLYAGLDTNSRTVHELVQRPATPDRQRDGLAALKAAGFELWVSIMLGLGGATYSAQHIAETTACLNGVDVPHVSIRTLACGDQQPLTRPVREGHLELAWAGATPHSPVQAPLGTLDELRYLIRHLDGPVELICDHATNFTGQFRGRLPEHREALLDAVALAEQQLSRQRRPAPMRIFV